MLNDLGGVTDLLFGGGVTDLTGGIGGVFSVLTDPTSVTKDGGGVMVLSGGIGVLDLGSDGVREPGGIGPGGIPIIGVGDLVLGSTFSRAGRVMVGFG